MDLHMLITHMDHTYKQRHATHRSAKRLTDSQKYILTPPVTCL